MKSKLMRWLAVMLVSVMAISFGAVAARAQYSPMQVPDTPQNDNDKDKSKPGPKVNKAEEDAYKALFASRSGPPPNQIQLGEAFVTKFPQSHYLAGVYGQLTTAYFAANDIDKMMASGAKALDLNPDNVDVLSLLAMAISRRVRGTTPDAVQQLQKAEAYARHAIELIPNIPKPDGVDDTAFEAAKNDKLSMAHSGLGLIDSNHGKWDDARTELMLAVKLASTPDPVDYYLLGNADVNGSYYKDAAAAYAKCSVSGPLAGTCKTRGDDATHKAATELGR